MIKVNLLHNKVEDTSAQQMTAASQSAEVRDALVKIVIMLIPTISLMVFESHNLNQLSMQLAQANQKVSQLQSQAAQLADQVNANKGVQDMATELKDKLKIIKQLSKLRLRQVKTLDFMESSIPERVWLNTIDYKSEKTHPDSGIYDFTGDAVSTADLSQFIKKLEQSAYLQNVIVVENKEVAFEGQGDALVRDFHFIANVENGN